MAAESGDEPRLQVAGFERRGNFYDGFLPRFRRVKASADDMRTDAFAGKGFAMHFGAEIEQRTVLGFALSQQEAATYLAVPPGAS